jgi:undecaprenyl-diphosphatase
MAGILNAIILGIIQGITEWLPVSSKGNVTAVGQFMGMPTQSAFGFAILLHIGTLIAAAIYFRKEIIQLLELKDRKLLKFIATTLVFTGITAVPCYFLLKKILEQETIQILGIAIYSQTIFLLLLGFFLLVTGLLQKKAKKSKENAEANLSGKNAAFLGLGQGFTVLPGMSRSGTTVSIMLFEKFSPEQAFRLSFIISVPAVILGELSFNLLEAPQITIEAIIGIIAAAIVGFASIHALLKIARKINFSKFCIALGIIYLAIATATIAMPFIA